MRLTFFVVVTLCSVALASPAAAAQDIAEQSSDTALVDDAPALVDDAGERLGSTAASPDDGGTADRAAGEAAAQTHARLPHARLPAAAAAAIGGGVAAAGGITAMAAYVMVGGFIGLRHYPHGRSMLNVASAMMVAAPLVFGALTLVGAVGAGALAWCLGDVGLGGIVGATAATLVGVFLGIPLAAAGVAAASIGAMAAGGAVPPLSGPIIIGGLALGAVIPVVTVSAGVAGLAAGAAWAGDASERFLGELRE